MHSFIYSFIRSFIDSVVHWIIGCLIHCFVGSLTCWFIDSLVHCFVGLLIVFIRSLIRWFLHSAISWFTDSLGFTDYPLVDSLIPRDSLVAGAVCRASDWRRKMPCLTTPIIFLTNLKIYQQLKPARPGPLFSETCSFGSKISGQNIILQLVYCTRLSCLIAQSPTCDVSIHVSGVLIFSLDNSLLGLV
jgi:ABC-type microcin C transport system permease subunit YejE